MRLVDIYSCGSEESYIIVVYLEGHKTNGNVSLLSKGNSPEFLGVFHETIACEQYKQYYQALERIPAIVIESVIHLSKLPFMEIPKELVEKLTEEEIAKL